MTYKNKRRIVRYLLFASLFALPFIELKLGLGHIFPLMLLFFGLFFLFIYMTQLWGRLYCGWFCPQTLLVETYRDLTFADHPFHDEKLKRYAKKLFNLLMAAAIGLALVLGLRLHGFGYVLAVIIFVDLLFIGRTFCKTVCPYAMFQSIMYDADTMRIGMHPDRQSECIQCDYCVDICQTGIDIKDGLSNKCVACADCIDACASVMRGMNNPPCIDYYYGQQRFRPFRANTIVTFALALLFIAWAVFRLMELNK